MLTEFLCSSAGERACTVPWICENWRLVLMISADWNRRDLEGERWYQVNWDAVFWYWFFFFYFLFIHFFLYCRRKDLSANASVPHFGTLDIFSCLFQVLKFLTTHPSACKLLASRKRPCSPNMVSFLPSSKSSLTQLHLRSLGHLSTWTLSDMSPSRFPPLLISLWLAELY